MEKKTKSALTKEERGHENNIFELIIRRRLKDQFRIKYEFTDVM